jgi:hypothetical protein
MKIFPVKSPLDGEQVIAVSPELDKHNDKDWRRRVNNFTGRSLTHTALRTEQSGRSGRIVSLGQLLSPGVVNGLVADKSVSKITGTEQKGFLDISNGYGLAASGETVTLNTALHVEINEIPVFAPVADLSALPLDTDSAAATADEGTVEAGSNGELSVRKLGPRLQDVIDSGLVLPRAAILVLQPVRVEMNIEQGDDPCELDAENYAYENWQLVDAARLVLYSWPEEVISLPGQPGDTDWRNQIANSIFMYEKNLPAGEVLPWMKPGVAIGLIGFSQDWKPLFVDSHAVVRSGGKRRRSASVLAEIGNRFMWQARFQQFNEQLAEFMTARQEVQSDDGLDSATRAATQFRYLPPVGVLPKDFIDLTTKKQNFFPLAYKVEAIAIPYEQLDVVIQDSASLAHYDFNRSDRIQALVPVPQVYYEPDLLKTEFIDPEFDFTIKRFTDTRNDWLGRRLEIRRKASAINKVIRGEAITFEKPDSAAVDYAELAQPFENALIEYGDSWQYQKAEIALPANWQKASFDDSSWLTGSSGFGYGLVEVKTELGDMQDNYSALAIRKKFNLSEHDDAKHYQLEVVTNGGFIAYLNGEEIKKHNLSSDNFSALADKTTESNVYRFDLGDLSTTLLAGENIIALQAHSSNVSAPGFSFLPRLIEIQYVEDIEDDDFGISIERDDTDKPVLENFEPVYSVENLQGLEQYFNSKTYTTDDGKDNLIWTTEEIAAFNQIKDDGLEGFISFIQDKVNNANDKVDFGFIRLQTDIYRIRQFMLGSVEATKLATSPVLAGIAKGDTAAATKQEISKVAAYLSSQEKAGSNAVTDVPGTTGGAESDGKPDLVFNAIRGDSSLSGDISFVSSSRADTFGGLDSARGNDVVSGKTKSSATSKAEAGGLFPGNEKLNLEKESRTTGGLLGGNFSVDDIEEQSSIVGSFQTFRNVTVGERLNQSLSEEAIFSGRASKAETIGNILSSGLSMDGLKVPGIKGDGNDDIDFNFSDINDSVLGAIRDGVHDPAAFDDEASIFNAGIRSMENASAVLRLTEGRIKTYKTLLQRCRETLAEFNATRKRLDRRLKIISDELAESRHDVSVSRALNNEELERIEAINARRQAVIEEYVPFLVFRRPRLSDVLVNVPVHDLQPDLSQAALPLCDVDDAESPEEISAMMDVLTEAPIKWYKISSKVLKDINRVPDIFALVKNAKSRAINKTSRHRLLSQRDDSLNTLAQGINKSLQASYSMVSKQRKFIAEVNLNQFNQFGWAESQKRANELVSLGDVIDGNNGRKGASKKAAQELEQISRVSFCLYLHFTQVLPSLRLDWAERLSQYDAPFNLRNLYSLPRWGEIDFIERNEMQKLVDWLYSRINVSYRDASNMMNDLVRICILLSSHAPVNKLIAGHVAEPSTLQAGSKVNIIADLTRIRIGMNMAMVADRKTVAQGTVIDIAGDHVVAQVASTLSKTIMVEKNTKVQLGEPGSMGGINYSQNLHLFNRK